MDKMVHGQNGRPIEQNWCWIKSCRQNGMDKIVYRQNRVGQNGADKMMLDKMVQTKWYMDKMVYGQSGVGQNGTDKVSSQTINPAPTINMIF